MMVCRLRERRQLASLINDELLQQLSAVQAQVDLAAASLGQAYEEPARQRVLHHIERARKWLVTSVDTLRRVAGEAGPPLVVTEELHGILAWLVAQVEQVYHVPIQLEIKREVGPTDIDMRMLLLEAAREVLGNAAEEAQAERLTVELNGSAELLTIRVRSRRPEGVETPGDAMDASAYDAALAPLRECLEAFRGSLRVDVDPEAGPSVTLYAPTRLLPKVSCND